MNSGPAVSLPPSRKKRPALSQCAVFFDFDNTLTSVDVLDDILERFSVDNKWRALEEEWQAGKLGTKECLEGQFRSVRVTKERLEQYLSTVTIDPSFTELLGFLKERKIPAMIVSDNFSWVIKKILKFQGISGILVYSNEIEFQKDRLAPSFPYQDPACPRCAHCKKRHLLSQSDKTLIYIGDGLSDVCPAQEADWVFAKGSLLEYLKENGRPCIPFETLTEVHRYFLEWGENGKLKNH